MCNTYYLANLMKGVMINNLPIADIKILAKQYFGEIPNINTQRLTMSAPVAKAEHLKKWCIFFLHEKVSNMTLHG